MTVNLADLAARVRSGKVQPVYVMYGDELLLQQEAHSALCSALKQAGYDERDVRYIEGNFAWRNLNALLQAGSLFSPRRVLDLRLPSGKPGVEGASWLSHYAAHPTPDTVLLLTLPKLDRAQMQSAWFTALESTGATVACPTVGPAELPDWLATQLRKQGHTLEPAAMDWLLMRLQGNLLAARQELDKLALLHPPGFLTAEALQAAVTDVSRYDVWSLGEALVRGDAPAWVAMVSGLKAEGEPITSVLWAVSEECRSLLRVGLAQSQGEPMSAALRRSRVWGRRQQLYPQALSRLSAGRLREALLQALRIDRAIKGVGEGDPWA